jgi:CubicO group peptidase (beta-lactamase class C family)
MTLRARWSSLLLALFLTQTLAAQDWNELRRTVRDELQTLKAPGAAIAVVQDGRVVFAEGFGVADVAAKTPITPQTRFRVGSLTKMFTAAAILSEPRVKLDAPVRTFLPDLPPRIGALTFEQLLTHRAGLVDRLSEEKPSDRDVMTEPDRLFSYSSLGYGIAGRAAAAAAGMPFEDFLTKALFVKLAMTATSFRADPSHDSVGYKLKKGRPIKTEFMTANDHRPGGFLWSNLDDLSRFAIAFMNGGLDPRIVDAMSTPRTDVTGDPRRYSYGAMIVEEGGAIAIYHNGDEPGGSSMLKMIPSKKAAVIVLTNLMGRMSKSTATALRLASGVTVPEPAKEPYHRVSRADAKEIAGLYENYRGFVIRANGDGATIGPWLPWFLKWLPFRRELVSYGDGKFGILRTSLGPDPLKFTIVRGGDGRPEFMFIQGRAYKRRTTTAET